MSANAMKIGEGVYLSCIMIVIPSMGSTSQIGDRRGQEEVSMANIENCWNAWFHVLKEKGPWTGF